MILKARSGFYFLPGMLLLLINTVIAQELPASYNFVYRCWNNQSGLPQNTVYDLARDSAGYLWGATEEGLFRFDGAEFTLVNESNTPGLYSNTFYDVLASGKDLWASSRNSIVRIRNKVEQILDFRNYLKGGWIQSLEKDATGRLWVGSSAGALYYVENDSIHVCPYWDVNAAGSIQTLNHTREGMFIGTARGLFRMNDPVSRPLSIPRFRNIGINCFTRGAGDELWIGTATKGLFHIAADTVQYTEESGLKENFISSVYWAKEGRLWFGFRSTGYQVLDKGKLITPGQSKFASDAVRCILPVEENLVWMGTNSSGLVQLKPTLIEGAPPASGLAGKIILPVYQHANEEIWVGTAGKGVSRLKDGRTDTYTESNGLSNNLVLSVYGRKDHIYIGTSNGLDRFNMLTQKIDKHYTEKDGLQSNGILCIFNDSRNCLWITSRMGGLHRMKEDGIIKTFPLHHMQIHPNLLCVYEDKQHNIWIGTRGAGMLRIDQHDQVEQFHQKQNFPADIVYAFFEDGEGDLWMSTEKGLVVYNDGKFRVFDKQAGLFFNETYRILEDPQGYVWLSGNLGLQRVALSELLAVKHTASSRVRLAVRLFNTLDGMPNSETNGGFFPAGWAMRDGTLWFPTVQGVAVADHGLIGKESHDLNIQVQSLRFGNNEYLPSASIEMPPGVYNFEIRYTNIDFSKASDIQFHYRLKGLDDGWTQAGNRHIAYFSELAPGKYTFEVKAEQYGYWSPTAVLQFRVLPHFYQATWFKIACMALGLLAIVMVVRYVKHAAKRKLTEQQNIFKAQITGQEKERQLISTELHDSINQQLTTAKIYLDFAKTNASMQSELIAKSETMVNTVINDIRSLCHSLTPPSLKDIGLKEALEDLLNAYSLVGKLATHLQYELGPDAPEEDLQFNLFRITQEQMNNIASHSEATQVWLSFEQTAAGINVSISDDGQGFDLKQKQKGLGFNNIRNRLAIYGGKMEIRTAPGHGCALILFIPVSR